MKILTHYKKDRIKKAYVSCIDGQVNLSNIQTVSKERFGDYITKLSKEL